MANFWFKLKLWTKAALIALLVLYVILFTYFNSQEQVQFWYWFRHQPQTNLLLLVLCSFIAGVVGTILGQTTFRTLRQFQEMKLRGRMDRLDRDLIDRKSKAAMLQTRENSVTPAVAPSPVIEPLETRRQI